LAVLRCAESQRFVLKANQSVTVQCHTDHDDLMYKPVCAIVQSWSIPSFVEITPAVVQFNNKKQQNIAVTLANITSNVVVIAPRCVIGKLQSVTVDTVSDDCSDSDVDVLNQVHMGEDSSEEERLGLFALLERHIDIFLHVTLILVIVL